jgi:hypothetical protein
MVVVRSALQMGWNESPAFFCATTETVRDVSQPDVDRPKTELPAHSLESLVEPTLPPRRQSSTNGASHQWSRVYVDDHIMAAVEDTTGTLLRRKARATLHVIQSVFTAPGATTMEDAKDPISEKKLHKGDGCWDTTKEILGYMLDGIAREACGTEVFPVHRGTTTACGTYPPSGESFLYPAIQCVAGPKATICAKLEPILFERLGRWHSN